MSLQLPNTLRSVLCRSCLHHRTSGSRIEAITFRSSLPAKRPLSTSFPITPYRISHSTAPSPLQLFTPRQHIGAQSSSIASPSSLTITKSGIFAQVFRRAFSSARPNLVRQTYFPRGSGYGGRPDPPGGWFRNFRRRIDRIPAQVIVYALIAANVAIFLLWQYAMQSWQRFRDPSLYHFLTKNFVLNEANMMAGRVWTLLTACFSHSGGSHIFVNCLSLYFVAPAVASLIGSSAFLGLYLGGGIVASLISLTWHRMRGDKWAGSEGASGAIYASLAFYGAIFPNTTFLLFFIVPMPAWALIGGVFAYDGYSAIFRPGSGTDSAGHLGGIVAGLMAALYARRRGFGGRFGRF